MVIGGGQRLLLRLSERCNEAPCHGSVRVSYPTYIMHENFRLVTYTLELFDFGDRSLLVPLLGVALLISAFLLNLSANKLIQGVASVLGFIKIGGIILFGVVGVIIADSVGMETSARDLCQAF